MPDVVIFGRTLVAQHPGAIPTMHLVVAEANTAVPADERMAMAVSLLEREGLSVAVRRGRARQASGSAA